MNKIHLHFREIRSRKLRKDDFFLQFLRKKAKLVSNMRNKGSIFVKIFLRHEILANFRENICFPESFREIYWKIQICEAVKIFFLIMQCEKCVRTGLPKPGS